jgi:hypothetical protein
MICCERGSTVSDVLVCLSAQLILQLPFFFVCVIFLIQAFGAFFLTTVLGMLSKDDRSP